MHEKKRRLDDCVHAPYTVYATNLQKYRICYRNDLILLNFFEVLMIGNIAGIDAAAASAAIRPARLWVIGL